MATRSPSGPSPSGRDTGLPDAPACPFCDGESTELVNAFGSHASVSTYWCRDCRSPFEVLKWKKGKGDAAGRGAGSRGGESPGRGAGPEGAG